jgi:hypothetical protein
MYFATGIFVWHRILKSVHTFVMTYHNPDLGRVRTITTQFPNETDPEISDAYLVNKTIILVLNGRKMVFLDSFTGKSTLPVIRFLGKHNFIYLKNGDIIQYQPKRLWYNDKYWLLPDITFYKKVLV